MKTYGSLFYTHSGNMSFDIYNNLFNIPPYKREIWE